MLQRAKGRISSSSVLHELEVRGAEHEAVATTARKRLQNRACTPERRVRVAQRRPRGRIADKPSSRRRTRGIRATDLLARDLHEIGFGQAASPRFHALSPILRDPSGAKSLRERLGERCLSA